jgi:hypothetical protein
LLITFNNKYYIFVYFYDVMNNEQQRIKFINTTMKMVNDLCDDLYESLFDEDFSAVEEISININEILRDLTETFKNEI